MTVQPYTFTGEVKGLDKTLTAIGDPLTVQPYGALDILHPVFILTYSAGLVPCNYCYVSEFEKYYFCTPSLNPAGQCILHCDVDPLYTWRDGIRAASGLIMRSESVGEPSQYIDTKLPVLPDEHDNRGIIASNNELSETGDYCYILTVLGGA